MRAHNDARWASSSQRGRRHDHRDRALQAAAAYRHFIWSESGWAEGVYQWDALDDARAFYSGPWLAGIVERYGMHPHIEFYEVFALTDNARGTVELFREPQRPAVR